MPRLRQLAISGLWPVVGGWWSVQHFQLLRCLKVAECRRCIEAPKTEALKMLGKLNFGTSTGSVTEVLQTLTRNPHHAPRNPQHPSLTTHHHSPNANVSRTGLWSDEVNSLLTPVTDNNFKFGESK